MTKMIPGLQNHSWFALTDAESCRLLSCSMTRLGKHHIDEYSVFENTMPEHERVRPVTNAGLTHHTEDRERRFAGEIIEWLQKKSKEHQIDRLAIFAPPRMLGVLRTVPLGSLKGHVSELHGDLMRLSAGQLADHPMIRELLTQHASGEESVKSDAVTTHSAVVGDHVQQLDGRYRTA